MRLFCFAPAGADASSFGAWKRALPAGVEVCPVEYAGRGRRAKESAFARTGPLVSAAANALYPWLDEPFAFFGCGMGALVAFEAARCLRRRYGRLPAHLFVSGCGAPQRPGPRSPLYTLPEEELAVRLASNGCPAAGLPALRADLEVFETYAYRWETPLDCPITVFAGLDDEEGDRRRLAGWREHTTERFAIWRLPGDRSFMETARAELLAAIAGSLHLSGRSLHLSAREEW